MIHSKQNASMPQLRVQKKPVDSYKQEIDSLIRKGVEDVHLLYQRPAPDSKAFDGVAFGSLIVDFFSGGIIEEVTQTTQAWVARNENRRIIIVMTDGDKIGVIGGSAKDQQKVIDTWIMCQIQR